MNTRRKFLLQSGMATTALLAAKPFQTLANTMAPVTGQSFNNNKVVLLHTGNKNISMNKLAVAQVSSLKKTTGNLLLVHAGTAAESNIASLNYDASLHLSNSVLNSIGNYKIVYKGDVKIGIITANDADRNVISDSNTLSSFLKKEKNCQLVVCLSQLGYSNKTGVDDRMLAQESTNIDIIISGHESNYAASPMIAHNSKKAEVIIHSAVDNGFALGNIEITFDKNHNKRAIDFNNLLSRVN